VTISSQPHVTTAVALAPHADEELRRIRAQIPQMLETFKHKILGRETPDALLRYGQAHKVACLAAEEVGSMDQWFFIGDIHGDFFALHTLLREAEKRHPDCRMVFLGDLVDRGDMPFECLFLLLDWGLRKPGRLAWIAGNHDIAFSITEQGTFRSQVSPAELLDVINRNDLFSGFRRQLGEFFVTIAQGLPRALLFPDGLLATHGGIPLVDLHLQGAAAADKHAYLEWLNTPACLQDFTWTRINSRPKKIPDRHSTGSQFGFRDFEAFCQLKPEWFNVARMINGHEHPRNGFDRHSSYVVKPALTMLGLGFDESKAMPDAYANYTDTLYLAQGVPDALPEVLPISVVREELEMIYGNLVTRSGAPGLSPAVVAPLHPTLAVAPSAPRPVVANVSLAPVSKPTTLTPDSKGPVFIQSDIL
jgi:hypothetical protein